MELEVPRRCIGSTICNQLVVVSLQVVDIIPPDSVGTSAVAYKLYQDGSKFRWPFQNPVAFA